MLLRKKPSARLRRVRRVILIVLAGVIILSAYIEFAVKTQLADVIETELKTIAQSAVNIAVTEYLRDHPETGESLTALNLSDSGAVTSVTSDPSVINALKAEVSERSQENIDALSKQEGVTVPLGSFTGLVLLANVGPCVSLDIASRQTVLCSLHSAFESAGVNQTLHHIFLTVSVDLTVYNPFRIGRTIRTETDFEIAQTVIVGSVPNYGYGSVIP